MTHAERVYTGEQDPTPLFAALAGLGPVADRVRLVFQGGDPALPPLYLARSNPASGERKWRLDGERA